MLTALDENGNRVGIEKATNDHEYHCEVCGGKLGIKNGEIRVKHFYHSEKTESQYDENDDDDLSPWHRKMQSFFPNQIEIVFFNEDKSERRRADVYIEDTNTVIEFQHSPITPEVFRDRTLFHLKAGRKVVWIFDESREEPKEGDEGKLRLIIKEKEIENLLKVVAYPHNRLTYKWIGGGRKVLLDKEKRLPQIQIGNNLSNYAVYVYTGAEPNNERVEYVRRIVNLVEKEDEEGKVKIENISLSISFLGITKDMDTKQFFKSEWSWIKDSPRIEQIIDYRNYYKTKGMIPKELYENLWSE